MKKNKIVKINKKGAQQREVFLKNYDQVEELCCNKFGITSGGVREYVSRLNNIRFAPERDEVLPKLVEYANKRIALNSSVDAMIENEPVKADSEWLKEFAKKLAKKKDPISVYLKKARRYARNRRFVRVLIVLLILALIAAGVFIAMTIL